MLKRTTTVGITVGGETWKVPRGFGKAYKRAALQDLALIAQGRPDVVIDATRDLLLLVGYDVRREDIAEWSLRKRIEAQVYAANVHLRASDNPLPAHLKPGWLQDPWLGTNPDKRLFAGPAPTECP